MNITVYLGASGGNDPTLKDAVRELGHFIGESGNALVYGGSKNGLMGELAESVLKAGGEVTGVEPQFFIDKGYEYDAITRLIVTRDMTERKAKMIELGDAFIAFPGGTGTLEEISEVMSKVSLKQLDAPCILYDLLCRPQGPARAHDRDRAFQRGAAAGHLLCRKSRRYPPYFEYLNFSNSKG